MCIKNKLRMVPGEESRGSSGRGGGMGAMMLANLQGLTRSRPDLLRQGVDTFPTVHLKYSGRCFVAGSGSVGTGFGLIFDFSSVPPNCHDSC